MLTRRTVHYVCGDVTGMSRMSAYSPSARPYFAISQVADPVIRRPERYRTTDAGHMPWCAGGDHGHARRYGCTAGGSLALGQGH